MDVPCLKYLLDSQAVLKFPTILNNSEMDTFTKIVLSVFGGSFHRQWASPRIWALL